MKKTIRVLTDILMYVSMCFLAGTGLLIHYRLVPGFRGGHGLELLGWTRHEWGSWHLWTAYLLLALVVVHLVLNFGYIRKVICRKTPGVLVLLGLGGLAILLFFLCMPVTREPPGRGGRHATVGAVPPSLRPQETGTPPGVTQPRFRKIRTSSVP